MDALVNLLFKKTFFFFLFGGICLGSLSGQTSLSAPISPASPVAASLGIYGEIPVSKYTGIPDITIPLYTIDLKTMQIPITLSYHPGAVRVEADASWVGLGWTLNAGGSITREVKGHDDFDTFGYYTRFMLSSSSDKRPVPKSMSDLSCYYMDGGVCTDYFQDDIRYDVHCSGLELITKRSMRLDCEPDLFSYNFLGYSGKFVIKEGSNEAVLEKPEDDLKIRFDSRHIYAVDIIVTLPSGDELLFNQYESSAPFSGATTIENAGDQAGQSRIVTWHLGEIRLADGNVVTFEYATKNNIGNYTYLTHTRTTERGELPGYTAWVKKELCQEEIPSSKCGGIELLPDLSIGNVISPSGNFAYSELYLKKIDWLWNRIDFIHEERTDYGRSYHPKDTPVRLKALEVKNGMGKFAKGYSFKYSVVDGRLRLDSLFEYGTNGSLPPYRFTYDARHHLPTKTSLCCDVWGYYNGTYPVGINHSLFPEIVSYKGNAYFNWEYPPRYNSSVIESGRNVRCNPDYITTGMLTKINYPTGGFAEFTFEANSYFSDQAFAEKKGGGVRIARIKTDAQERIYDYNDGDETSGVLLVYPTFSYVVNTMGVPRIIYTSRSATQLQGNTMGNIVGYGKVTETIIENGKTSSVVDYFRNNKEMYLGNLYTRDEYGDNGYLLKKEIYENDSLVQRTQYTYLSIPDEFRPNQDAMKFNDGIIHFYKVFPYHRRLVQETINNYYSNGQVRSSFINYDYNDKNYCVNKIVKKGNGKELIERITYSADLKKGVYSSMNGRHFWNKPVEVTRSILSDGVERIVSSELTLYDESGFPKNSYKLECDMPLSSFTPFSATQGDNMDSRYNPVPETTISYAPRSEVILPEYIKEKGGAGCFYVWGHFYDRLVAKLENVTKSELQEHFEDYEQMMYETMFTDTDLANLIRLQTSLPNARITIYVYDNLIGLKRCILPDGTSIYYEYDGFNRLKCVKDNFGNVIEQYDYGYKQ